MIPQCSRLQHYLWCMYTHVKDRCREGGRGGVGAKVYTPIPCLDEWVLIMFKSYITYTHIANVIGFLSLHSGIDLMCYYYHSKVNPCQTCATVLSRCIAVKKNTDIFACFEILQNCKTPNNDTHFKFRYAIDISSAIASPGMKLMFTKWSCQLF